MQWLPTYMDDAYVDESDCKFYIQNADDSGSYSADTYTLSLTGKDDKQGVLYV